MLSSCFPRRQEEVFSLGRYILGEDCFGTDFLCDVMCVWFGADLRSATRGEKVVCEEVGDDTKDGVGTGGSHLSSSNLGRNQLSRVFSSFGEVPLLRGSLSRGWA
jgi:hypothetical protein